MAYPYYPTGYNAYYPATNTGVGNLASQMLQSQLVPQAVPQVQQIQSGGLVRVMNEEEAKNYPVAPGYSVTFIDDSVNYCYTKTAGFSQFDKPRFEKYRLIKEETEEEKSDAQPKELANNDKKETKKEEPEYALKFDFEKMKSEFRKVKEKVDKLYEQLT